MKNKHNIQLAALSKRRLVDYEVRKKIGGVFKTENRMKE